MSISAVVWDVTRESEFPKLWLRDNGQDSAGQASLQCVGNCGNAELLVGLVIWAGGGGPIMLGDVEIGQRIGYAKCELRDDQIEIAIAKKGQAND